MILGPAFEELIILPNLLLKRAEQEIVDTQINISVEFKLGTDLVTGILSLDEVKLNFEQRMELLQILSESLNIFIGKTLTKEKSIIELSAPKLFNLDREIDFQDNITWYKFSLVYEETSYPVVLLRKGYL